MAITCPCSGVAYAQIGDLVLEDNAPARRPSGWRWRHWSAGLRCGPTRGGKAAVLPRRPMDDHDVSSEVSPKAIRARPPGPVLKLADYDHDGVADEFLLQVDALRCGKQLMVTLGTLRGHPSLHALTSADRPERPLALYRWQWEALARDPRPVKLADWPCGDHGTEDETTLLLRADHGAIHATRVTGTCPDDADVPPHAKSDKAPLSSASGMVSRSPSRTSCVVGSGTRFHGVTTASHQAVNRPEDQDRRLSSTSGSTAAMAFGSQCIVIIPAPQRA